MSRLGPAVPTAILVVGAVAGVLWGQRSGAFDTESPTVHIHPPPADAPWPPTIRITAYDGSPGVAHLKARLDDTEWALPVAGGSVTPPADLAVGQHRLEVVAIDGSWSKNRTTHTAWVERQPPVSAPPVNAPPITGSADP